MNPNLIVLSRATYVGSAGTSSATPAATYAFFTRDYKPPEQPRYIQHDIVKNQNGRFKWIYDNGLGFRQWDPFTLILEDRFATVVGGLATTQLANLRTLQEHPGTLGMRTPEGAYTVHWSEQSIGQNFRIFPVETSDKIEFEVIVQFEEA